MPFHPFSNCLNLFLWYLILHKNCKNVIISASTVSQIYLSLEIIYLNFKISQNDFYMYEQFIKLIKAELQYHILKSLFHYKITQY